MASVPPGRAAAPHPSGVSRAARPRRPRLDPRLPRLSRAGAAGPRGCRRRRALDRLRCPRVRDRRVAPPPRRGPRSARDRVRPDHAPQGDRGRRPDRRGRRGGCRRGAGAGPPRLRALDRDRDRRPMGRPGPRRR
ncbi:MAG: hypothetical protein ACK559_13775 [bacterium]